jgi:hypothetical protein
LEAEKSVATRQSDLEDSALYSAIGRVASSSANLDDTLRNVLYNLVGPGDEVWVLFEGQSTDWLVSSIRTVLKVAGPSHFWSEGRRERLAELLTQADGLRRRRNVVIHGVWGRACFYRRDEKEFRQCIARPFNAPDNSETFYFMRSNQRKPLEEAHLSISDINALAVDYDQFNMQIFEIWQESRASRDSSRGPKR